MAAPENLAEIEPSAMDFPQGALVWRCGNSPWPTAGSERMSESSATLETFESSVLFGFEVRSVPDPMIGRTSNPAH
jgi:hypothetical protein